MKNILLGALSLIIFALLLNQNKLNNENQRWKDRLNNAYKFQKSMTGGTALYNGEMINYHIKTWDDGLNWYQVEFDTDGKMKIVGNIEDIYPNLVKLIINTDKLMDAKTDKNKLDALKGISQNSETNGLKVSENK